MIEIWKDIIGYEGLYQISNLGNIKALEKSVWNGQGYIHFPEIIRKPNPDKDGYLNITLSNCGKVKTYKIHRLVAEMFIPNLKNKPQVNHKDGNKTNNCADNLEWCTNQENQQHAYRTGLKNQKRRKQRYVWETWCR